MNKKIKLISLISAPILLGGGFAALPLVSQCGNQKQTNKLNKIFKETELGAVEDNLDETILPKLFEKNKIGASLQKKILDHCQIVNDTRDFATCTLAPNIGDNTFTGELIIGYGVARMDISGLAWDFSNLAIGDRGLDDIKYQLFEALMENNPNIKNIQTAHKVADCCSDFDVIGGTHEQHIDTLTINGNLYEWSGSLEDINFNLKFNINDYLTNIHLNGITSANPDLLWEKIWAHNLVTSDIQQEIYDAWDTNLSINWPDYSFQISCDIENTNFYGNTIFHFSLDPNFTCNLVDLIKYPNLNTANTSSINWDDPNEDNIKDAIKILEIDAYWETILPDWDTILSSATFDIDQEKKTCVISNPSMPCDPNSTATVSWELAPKGDKYYDIYVDEANVDEKMEEAREILFAESNLSNLIHFSEGDYTLSELFDLVNDTDQKHAGFFNLLRPTGASQATINRIYYYDIVYGLCHWIKANYSLSNKVDKVANITSFSITGIDNDISTWQTPVSSSEDIDHWDRGTVTLCNYHDYNGVKYSSFVYNTTSSPGLNSEFDDTIATSGKYICIWPCGKKTAIGSRDSVIYLKSVEYNECPSTFTASPYFVAGNLNSIKMNLLLLSMELKADVLPSGFFWDYWYDHSKLPLE